MAYETRRKQLTTLKSTLDTELSSYKTQWRDIADMISPSKVQFFASDTNKGDRRNQKIIDCTGTLAARTAVAGMMGGITSPARPWKRLTTPDPELAEFGPVKDWLHVVDQRMNGIFLRSNLYNSLPGAYGDVLDFGTAAMLIEEDFDSVIRTHVFPIGSYALALNDKLQVSVFAREFQLTVRQLVQKFGKIDETGKPDWSKFSTQVRNMYDRGSYDAWVEVCHVIQPNVNYNPNSLKSKKFESVYYEKGATEETYLRDSGYDYFPVLAPRWSVRGEDVYGHSCPGMVALGDVKQLQLGEKRSLQAIEKMVNPPMVGPSMLKTSKASILPGDITYVDERDGTKGFRPAHEITPKIQDLEYKQEQVRQRISRAYYEDLFLMLAQSDRREITAREIDERKEEKLLVLGPVLSRLNEDLLDPMIDITFDIMVRQGLIPEPPEELQGVNLKVEYVSIMHQAQKLAGLAGIERLAGFVGQVAQFDPTVIDKLDRDQMVDEYAEITGVPPRIIVPDEVVLQIRESRAQAQAQQAKAEQMAQGAKAAKDLSATSMEGNSALTALMQQAQAGGLVQ